MGIHKQFSTEIYTSSDPVKFAVADKLNNLGYYTLVVEDFGSDIKTYHPTKGYQEHEVEHRTIWESKTFPYESIHIPERKTRLLKDIQLFYWVVNKDMSAALVCNAKNCMRKEWLKIIPNNLIPHGEEFYDIPIIKFKYFSLPTGG